jgi:RNA polymerase-binding protein DksA
MKIKQLTYYKNLLLQKRAQTLQAKEKLKATLRNTYDDDMVHSSHDGFSADNASHNTESETISLLLDREVRFLQQIERALEAINLGTYGKCRECGKSIDEARLQAVPTTFICIACKKQEA